jgi:hypothetical protein
LWAQLPTLGLLDDSSVVHKGTNFTAVGYGVSSGRGTDVNVRRYAVSTLSAITPNYLELSQKEKKGQGGTYRILNAGHPNCSGTGTFSPIWPPVPCTLLHGWIDIRDPALAHRSIKNKYYGVDDRAARPPRPSPNPVRAGRDTTRCVCPTPHPWLRLQG